MAALKKGERFLFLCLFILSIAQGCPKDYFSVSSKLCLHLASPTYKSSKSYCKDKSNGQPFGRRLTPEIMEELGKAMKEQVKKQAHMRQKAFIGFEKSTQRNSKDWIFIDNNEKISEKDYTLWMDNPKRGLNCAVVSPTDKYMVKSYNCDNKMIYLCKNDKDPCSTKQAPYIDYYGLCLLLALNTESYSSAKSKCLDGHLFSMRDESNIPSVKEAYYNALFIGGVYVGLKKQRNGKWLYDNGEEETDNWAPDSKKTHDCGRVRLTANMTAALYTFKCGGGTWFLCEISEKESETALLI